MFKGIIIAILLAIFTGLFPTTADARTFSNDNSRSATFVTVGGTIPQDYVMRDANGQVIGFGTGIGRFQVMPGGETSVEPAESSLLQRIRIPAGESVTIENTHLAESRRLMTDISTGHSRYNIIIRDRRNQAIQVAKGLIFSNITIPAGGSATIYAVDPLLLFFPSVWQELTYQAPRPGTVVGTRTVQTGDSVAITNYSTSEVFTLRRQEGASDSIIDYSYLRGAFDESLVRTDIIFEEMVIEPGFTWTVTVRRGQPLTLLIPQEWLANGLTITDSVQQAVQSLEIRPGNSMRLTNLDPDAAYDVTIESIVPEITLQYDYVWETAMDFGYGMESAVSNRTLFPGGSLIITPSNPVRILLPAVWGAVMSEDVAEPAIFRTDIARDVSLRVNNVNEAYFRHIGLRSLIEADMGLLDYIRWDHEGQIDSFGVTEADHSYHWSHWELAPGESAAFTNREHTPLRLYFPYSWLNADLELVELSQPILSRQVIRPGEVLEIQSGDPRFDRRISLEHAAQPMAAVPEYHFVLRNTRDVVDFGVSQSDSIALLSRGRTVIAPARGTSLSLVVPTEWQERLINSVKSDTQPLHRVVFRPGGRIRLENRMGIDVTVQTTGRYFLRWEDDDQRISPRETALEGDITIPNRTRVTIIGAPGADLEIWMPSDWRSRLLR